MNSGSSMPSTAPGAGSVQKSHAEAVRQKFIKYCMAAITDHGRWPALVLAEALVSGWGGFQCPCIAGLQVVSDPVRCEVVSPDIRYPFLYLPIRLPGAVLCFVNISMALQATLPRPAL